MTQNRAEIVEAMAREMCRAVHPCKSMVAEIMTDATYLSGREGDAAALTLAGQFRIEAEAALDIALKAAADVARNACLVPPDGGAPTETESEMCDRAADAILALTIEE